MYKRYSVLLPISLQTQLHSQAAST